MKNRFAISKQSEKKEGAWQFIKFMLDNYIDHMHNGTNTPIKMSLLEEAAHNATIEQRSSTGFIMYRMVETGPGAFDFVTLDRDNTLEENQKMWDLLYKTNTIRPHDTVIMDIIREELRYYIAGQKPAETVMDIIENRVNLYLSELE